MRVALPLIAGLALAHLAGCNAISDLAVTRPLSRRFSETPSAALEVVSPVPESAALRQRLETLAVVALREAQVFRQVLRHSRSEGESIDVTLRLNMVEASVPGTLTQTLLGLFAPRSRVVIEGECIEPGGEVLGAFRAEGASAMGYVYSGGFEQAAEACLARIVKYVQDNR